MSPFEFVFSLFGLLLGLSLAEVLTGFARAIEQRLRPGTAMRLGWRTPLLGAFVILDLLSFWMSAWINRDLIAVSPRSLLAITAFTGAYFLAARLVFPSGEDVRADHDTHFEQVRAVVIGIMLALLACQIVWYLSVPAIAAKLVRPFPLVMTLLLAALMLAGMFVRHRRWSTAIIAALVGRYLLLYAL